MNTHINCSGNIHRLRLQSIPEAKAAGTDDARQLLEDLNELFADPDGARSVGLLIHALTETIALAAENRAEECHARLEGFAEAVGPILLGSVLNQPADPASELCNRERSGHHLITLLLDLTDQEAQDYAQFLKRVGFSEYRGNAVDQDEAYRMLAAGEKIRRALADAGYAPR